MKKYVIIHRNGQNKIYGINNTNVESKISKFIEEGVSSVHYLFVITNKGETLKLQWDSKRTLKVLPEYLGDSVSGEIVEVGESFVSQVHLKNRMYYL